MGVSASCITVSLLSLFVVVYGEGVMVDGGGALSIVCGSAVGLGVGTMEKSLGGGLDVGRELSFAIWGFVKISRNSCFPRSPISGHFEEVLKIGQFMSEEG